MSDSAKLHRWQSLIAQWRSGGQSIAAFCRSHDLPLHQFYYWRTRVDDCVTPSRLVPVVFDATPAIERSDASGGIAVRLPNGVELQLPADLFEQWLPRIATL